MSNCCNSKSEKLERPEDQENKNLSSADFKISKEAREKISELCEKQTDLSKPFLRIMVEAGGCAGLKYHIIIDDYIADNDILFKDEGNENPYLIIDDYSLEFLKDGALNYEETLEFAGFKIDNPNVTGNCSCGSSFSCSGS